MFEAKNMMFLISETPVHAGSGSSVEVIDLPIQREGYTEFPKIESSGLKGCIREFFEKKLSPGVVDILFGPDKSGDHAGCVSITDAKILLFPVKSLKGVFAWITCPLVLERLKRDLSIVGVSSDFTVPSLSNGECVVTEGSEVIVGENVVLEEFTFNVVKNRNASGVANWISRNVFPGGDEYGFWRGKVEKNLVILSDDDFTEFVKHSTEVITRNKIDATTGTAEEKALWTEEYLPQDTVMYSMVFYSKPRVKDNNSSLKDENDVKSEFEKTLNGTPFLIIGGHQTIGKGFMRVKFLK